MNEIEKNVRKQLLPSITGKNHITDEDRKLFALPLRMGGLDLNNTDFSRNYEWSQAICDPLENSVVPEVAETEQTLINRNIETERDRTSHSQKKLKLWKVARQKKN